MRVPVEYKNVDYTLDVVDVADWYKRVGDRVSEGEPLLHVVTLKADVDIAAPADGVLVEIVAPTGEQVIRPQNRPSGPWDALFGWIETGETGAKDATAAQQPEIVGKEVRPETPRPKEKIRLRLDREGSVVAREVVLPPVTAPLTKEGHGDFVEASPLVRKRSRELGVDLSTIRGTGPDSAITLEDLEGARTQKSTEIIAVRTVPADGDMLCGKIIELGVVQKAIAEHMEIARRCIPHAGSSVKVNFQKILKARSDQSLTTALEPRLGLEAVRKYLSLEAIVVEGIIRALESEFSILNSCYGCEHFTDKIPAGRTKVFDHINLGVAYDHPAGLLVPVLKGIEGASYRVIAERFDDLYQRMKKSKVKPAEFRDGTFTFNNVGALGGESGQSIITHGQSVIVSLHKIERDENSPFYGLADLAIRFDHRPHNGSIALRFLKRVKEFVEGIDFAEHVLSQF